MDMAIASDIYYKWNNTNAFSLTLHNNATYLKKYIKFSMLLVTSMILGIILNTKNMKEANLYLKNSYMC
jgi:hypothetical protein